MSNKIAELLQVSAQDRGINWLMESLQQAVELELSTLPPYLCGMWSVKDQNEPVRDLIDSVVLEEMFHMGLACNMLTTIGGAPKINNITMPTYPGNLPGGVLPDLKVHLAGLSKDYVKNVYMNIEYPEGGPLDSADRSLPAETPPTIGMFYDAILVAFKLLPPSSFTGNNQITATIGDNEIRPIKTMDDVKEAIGKIKEQGEGTSSSADDVDFGTELAHYYRFGEIYHGQTMALQSDGKTWAYTGAVIPFPADIYPMAAIPAGGYQNVAPATQSALDAFNTKFGLILSKLQSAWGVGDQSSLEAAIGAMIKLGDLATAIMAIPLLDGSGNVYGPNFVPIMPQPSSPATSAVGTTHTIRATKIMIIRHGEKPADTPPPEGPFGVNADGIQDHGHSLIVQGWQRAGALANFFAPTNGQLQNKAIAIPATVFACTAPPNAKGQPTGLRPRETITPLVDKLKQTGKVQTNFSFSETQDLEVATAAMACDGVVLISWEHKNISKIVSFIPTKNKGDVPSAWDGQRFDLVWVFDLHKEKQQYIFSQIPQLLLAGDSDKPMKPE